MTYLIIETFGGAEYAIIATDTDGNNLVFNTYEDAEREAKECQDGIVVEV
jgi:hypothetical protein